MTEDDIRILLDAYKQERFPIEQFLKRIVNFFQDNPRLHMEPLPAVHSIKYRMKKETHVEDKLKRKQAEEITIDNLFNIITDFAGVRVFHLYPEQLTQIHLEIMKQIDLKELVLYERPMAYTWDPDSMSYFQGLGIEPKVKASYYTSVHYVVMPKEDSRIKCEIQVRTLFEEVWGEIDHCMNYPKPIESVACREQLKVLAQLTTAGIRLANSIIKSQAEFNEIRNYSINK